MQEENEKERIIREQLQKKAEEGNVTAIQILEKQKAKERIDRKKREVLESAQQTKPGLNKDLVAEQLDLQESESRGDVIAKLKDLDISEIENYISSGSFKSLPPHMNTYLNWMQIAHDKYYQFKSKTHIIKYLMQVCEDTEGNKVSYYLASKVFNDMLTFFYSDKDLKKNNWYLYLAERVMLSAEVSWEMDDMEGYRKACAMVAEIMDKVKLDDAKTDPRLLEARPRFFFTSAHELGIPTVDRNELARQIDGFPVNEKTKQRVKSDLGTEKRDLLDGDTLKDEIHETE